MIRLVLCWEMTVIYKKNVLKLRIELRYTVMSSNLYGSMKKCEWRVLAYHSKYYSRFSNCGIASVLWVCSVQPNRKSLAVDLLEGLVYSVDSSFKL